MPWVGIVMKLLAPQTRILSIAAIPGYRRDNGRKQDQLYLVVERTLPTGKRYSVEVLGDAFEHGTHIEDAEFVDGAITVSYIVRSRVRQAWPIWKA